MTPFEKYLIEQGYKPYRLTIDKKVKISKSDNGDIIKVTTLTSTYDSSGKIKGFSTVVPGGLSIYYIKGNDVDNAFVYGLHEAYKPPTLIMPRPKINPGERSLSADDKMNRALEKYTPKEIYDAIKKGKELTI